jgi:hypothetical protein
MSLSQIIQVSSGLINVVNDPVPGLASTPGGTGLSPFQGQIGKVLSLDQSMVRYDSTVGTVYEGLFQYAKLGPNATANPAVGSVVFWDLDEDPADFAVTTEEDAGGTTDAAVMIAGIVLSEEWTVGYYSFIQIVGLVDVKYRAVLTSAGAVGSAVYAAAAGGADNGLVDVVDSANPALFSDVTLLQRRFLGVANELPVGGATSLIDLGFQRFRG